MSADLATFVSEAGQWLDARVPRRPPLGARPWGEGSDQMGVFPGESPERERQRLSAACRWQRTKQEAGYGSIAWPVEHGGSGLTQAHDDAFRRLEARYVTPDRVELLGLSLGIEAPTILALGTAAQKTSLLTSMREATTLCCQLFSEPGAGSDLGAIAMRATRDGSGWVLSGQKVWTTGAHHADIGIAICRSDATAPRRHAMTAFIVPMDAPGITIRPIRQMTGGSSFNEVFFDDVWLPDTARLGAAGEGWGVAMTMLGFERAFVARDLGGAGDSLVDLLVRTARHRGHHTNAAVRRRIVDLYIAQQSRSAAAERIVERAGNGTPGPEGSLLKLAYSRELRAAGDLARNMVGPDLAADSGAWGTYAWADFLCSVPGLRLGGGTDEIQKNTIAERVLGLPSERA